MNILNMIAVGIPFTIGLGYVLFFMWVNAPLARKSSGDWVADIWLTSYHGVGDTMYRQRFRSKLAAKLDCKLRAMGLDMILPTVYWVEGDKGQPVRLSYHFGIHHAVRRIGPLESKDFQAVWKTELPNESVFRGGLVNTLKDQAEVLAG